jgi:hypothetical protein
MNGCLIKNYFRTIAKGGWGEGVTVVTAKFAVNYSEVYSNGVLEKGPVRRL